MQRQFLLLAAGLTTLAFGVLLAGVAITGFMAPDELAEGWWAVLCQSDCGWYSSIAERGYDVTPSHALQANFGFYPAFPIAVWAVMTVSGLDFAHAALVLNAAYTLLFALLALSCREELLLRSDRDAAIFVLAFFLTPMSVFNRIPYTEMQFNLALLATFVAWRRGAFVAAAAAGVALTATRVTGVFLPLALLLELLLKERWRVLALLRAPDARFRALAVMPLGAVAFFIFLGFHVGDPLANFRVQAVGWNHPVRNPVETLVEGIASMSLVGLTSGLSFAIACTLLVVGAIAKRVPIPLAVTGLATTVLPTITGLDGLPRYALAIFMVYLPVPALRGPLLWLFLALLALLQMGAVVIWIL